MKVLNKDERTVFLSTVDKVIKMVESFEESGTEDTAVETIKEGKKNYEKLYTKILKSEGLDTKDIILLVSAADSVITLMVKQRNAMSEAIKMLDKEMSLLIEENLQNE